MWGDRLSRFWFVLETTAAQTTIYTVVMICVHSYFSACLTLCNPHMLSSSLSTSVMNELVSTLTFYTRSPDNVLRKLIWLQVP